MRRLTDLVISLLATLAAFLLSLPFWRDFGYFAESRSYWLAYFFLGFILAVYVFYTFIGSLRIVFRHAREDALATGEAEQPGARP